MPSSATRTATQRAPTTSATGTAVRHTAHQRRLSLTPVSAVTSRARRRHAASTTSSASRDSPVFGVRLASSTAVAAEAIPTPAGTTVSTPGIARGRGCSPARTAHATGCATGSAPAAVTTGSTRTPTGRTAGTAGTALGRWIAAIATIPADREADGRSRTTA